MFANHRKYNLCSVRKNIAFPYTKCIIIIIIIIAVVIIVVVVGGGGGGGWRWREMFGFWCAVLFFSFSNPF